VFARHLGKGVRLEVLWFVDHMVGRRIVRYDLMVRRIVDRRSFPLGALRR
jgi:hypothetical protein